METKDLAFFPRLILGLVKVLTPDERWQRFYLRWMKPINYAIICTIGMVINELVLRWLVIFLPFYLANFGAVVALLFWLTSMLVEPFGYLWGFQSKPIKE